MESLASVVLNHIHCTIRGKSRDEQAFWCNVNEWKLHIKNKKSHEYIKNNIFAISYDIARKNSQCNNTTEFSKLIMFKFIDKTHVDSGNLDNAKIAENFFNIFTDIIVDTISSYVHTVTFNDLPYGYHSNTFSGDNSNTMDAINTFIDCYKTSALSINGKLNDPNCGMVSKNAYDKLLKENIELRKKLQKSKPKRKQVSEFSELSDEEFSNYY